MAYRILSLDGGGIRGIYTAVLVERLEAAVPSLLSKVDLFAGTSTGGILALALAKGLRPRDIVALYKESGKEIFDDSWWDGLRDLGRLTGADYSNDELKKILRQVFGRTTLGQLGKRVLVPTFDLDNLDRPARRGQVRTWKAKFFHNFPGPRSDRGQLAVDVALRTSAAPTYFPAYQGFIDGGVVANNPSVAALAQAIDQDAGKQEVGDVRILSLGTGFNPSFIQGQDLDWGIAQWGRPLVNIMIEGVMNVGDYQCRQFLGRHYHRLNPMLPKPVALDDAGKTGDLIKYAKAVKISSTVAWIRENF